MWCKPAFIKVYHRIQQFDESRPFAPWFFKIVTHAAIQAAKQTYRQMSFGDVTEDTLENLIPDKLPNPDELAGSIGIARLRASRIATFVARTTGSHRPAILFGYV